MSQQPASRVVSQDVALQVLDAWGRAVDLPTRLAYDAADPWAVTVTFSSSGAGEPVVWTVGRDLLLRGLTEPAGEGDVQLFPSVDEACRAAVVMELSSPGGRLVTQLRSADLYRFLARSIALVPLGAEVMDLDLLVDALVGGTDA